MGTLLNRRRYMGGKPLAQMVDIEYLQSDGNQWIELGIYGSNDLDFTIDFEPTVLSDRATNWNGIGSFFGCYESSYLFVLTAYNRNTTDKGSFFFRTYGESQSATPKLGLTLTRTTITKSGDALTCPAGNLTLNRQSESFTNSVTMALFAQKNASSNTVGRCGYMKLYSIKFEKNNETLLDLIPVRIGQVGYMYDKVSGNLMGNETSTPFTLGPDKIGGGKYLIINMLCGYSVERRAA